MEIIKVQRNKTLTTSSLTTLKWTTLKDTILSEYLSLELLFTYCTYAVHFCPHLIESTYLCSGVVH